MKPNQAHYVLERHELGWLLCAAPGQAGVPPAALSECLPFLPEEATANGDLAIKLNRQGYHLHAVMALGLPVALATWDKQMDARLKTIEAEERWWCANDSDESSAAIFFVLCSDRWNSCALPGKGHGTTPKTGFDFGRCKRLLEFLPEWRERLPEVAAAYPASKWPAIIARWDELVAATNGQQSEILRSLATAGPKSGAGTPE